MTELETGVAVENGPSYAGAVAGTAAARQARIPQGSLRVLRATSANTALAEAWACADGWNPDCGNAVIFRQADPAGHFAGYLGERHVSAISILNYSPDLAFCGGLLVDPEHRGRGIAAATWAAAARHAGRRTLVADVPVHLIDKATQLGFASAFRILRFSGPLPPSRPRDPHVRPVKPTEHVSQIATLDAACFPTPRPGFAAAFATAAEHHALAYTDANGNVRGYGVLRTVQATARIGPLYAERSYQAGAIFDHLCALAADAGAVTVTIDVPGPSLSGRAIPETRGLPSTEVAQRMYRPGQVQPHPVDFGQLHALTCLGMG